MWRGRCDVAGHQRGQPPRAGLVEAEESHRLADGVELQVRRELLAQLDRHAVAHAQFDRLIAGFEIAVDQHAVDRLRPATSARMMRSSYSTSASISSTSPPRVMASATVCTVSTLPSSKRGFSTISGAAASAADRAPASTSS
jgi:hypothetical protein